MAFDQSHGYFDDISDGDWQRLQQIARDRVRSVQTGYKNLKGLNEKDVSFYDYFEPDFSCPYERRMGIPEVGDGPKWVCDPHRLARLDSCLVYSIGSHGDFSFETSIHNLLGDGTCEIHTFDPDPIYANDAPAFVTYHAWGLVASSEASQHPKQGGEIFKSIQETVQELGHVGRTIEVFKIDCEGCEWTSYPDWIISYRLILSSRRTCS